MSGIAENIHHHEPDLTVEEAIALAYCPAEGRCVPRCRHCRATPAEVERARAWLAAHRAEREAWATGKLAGMMEVLEHWTAVTAPHAVEPTWTVSDGSKAVADGLTEAQAEAIVQKHNTEVTSALELLNWYLGGA